MLMKPYWWGLTSLAGAPWSPSSGTVEVVGNEHVFSQGVLDQNRGPEAVEANEHDMSDRGRGRERRFDEGAIHRLERNSLPAKVGGGPASHAVKVGRELSPRKSCQCGEWQVERFGYDSADLDDVIDWNVGRGSGQMRSEARESVDSTLTRRERHVSLN